MAEPVAEIWTFPTDPAQFDNDERISYSKLDNKYIAVQDDGTELEFDAALKRWIPIADEADEALIEQQQLGYVAGGSSSGLNTGDATQASGSAQGKKRKQDPSDHGYGYGYEDNNGNSNNNNGRAPKNQKKHNQQRQQAAPRQNTAVYVTGLPLDATAEEVAELFSHKCGVIAEEIDSGRPRIKMYTDAETGRFKGDCLVVFFKPQSVDMAIMLLDDTPFRWSDAGDASSSGRMRVQAADSSYKKTQYDKQPASGEDGGREGSAEGGGARGKQSGRPNDKDRQKVIKKTQKLDAKLADWSDDEPSSLPMESKNSRWSKVVILRHMFTLQELEEDPAALLEIKEDIREECEKLGEVTNVVLYDQEQEGIVSVKFKKTDAAAACVELMDGRSFGGQTVEASIATGRERFKKTKNKDNEEDEDED